MKLVLIKPNNKTIARRVLRAIKQAGHGHVSVDDNYFVLPEAYKAIADQFTNLLDLHPYSREAYDYIACETATTDETQGRNPALYQQLVALAREEATRAKETAKSQTL